jgi:hypothetical protein
VLHVCLASLHVYVYIIYAQKSGYFGYLGYLPAKICLIVKKSPQLGFPTAGCVFRAATCSATFNKEAQLPITITTTISNQQYQHTTESRAKANRIAGEIVNGTTPTASIFLKLTGGKPLLLEGDEGE